MEASESRGLTLRQLQKDYARLTGKDVVVGWPILYWQTLRNASFGGIFVYRMLSNSLHSLPRFLVLRLLMRLFVRVRKDMEISIHARIGEGLVVFHGSGLVVGSGVQAGKNLSLEHGVTLGRRVGSSTDSTSSWPILGDDCFIGCGAAILGPVRVGDFAKVGANAVVLCDVPDHSTAVGVPARILPAS